MTLPIRRILSTLAFLFCTSCASSSGSMKWTDTDQAFRAELLRLIPIGTEISAAKKIMEHNGFSAKVSSGPFAGMPDLDAWASSQDAGPSSDRRERPGERSERPANLAGKSFLYCDRERRAGLLISRRYQAALVFESGKILDIVASTGLIGP